MEPLSCGPRKCVLIREVSLFQRLICTQKYTIGTSETLLIREVSLFHFRGGSMYISHTCTCLTHHIGSLQPTRGLPLRHTVAPSALLEPTYTQHAQHRTRWMHTFCWCYSWRKLRTNTRTYTRAIKRPLQTTVNNTQAGQQTLYFLYLYFDTHTCTHTHTM